MMAGAAGPAVSALEHHFFGRMNGANVLESLVTYSLG
jgi:hypothetical protein